MGRKRKRKSSFQDLRTYQFRPRNGLGLFFSKKNSNNTSSIFQYNHRSISPDSSFDNDEDVVEGILFTSFKELRGLENHSPLLMDSDSSDEEFIKNNNLYPHSSTLYEKISLQMLGSHYSMKKCGKLGRCFGEDPHSYGKRNIKRLESSISIKRPRVNGGSTFNNVSKLNSGITDVTISKSNELHLIDVVEDLSNIQPEKFHSKEIVDAISHPFLIKNLLKTNYDDENCRKFISHVPIACSNSNSNSKDINLQSLYNEVPPLVETNDEITCISSNMHGPPQYHYPPYIPFFSNNKKTSSQYSIIPDKNFSSASPKKYFENSTNIPSAKASLSPTIINRFEPISLQHESTIHPVSPTMKLSTIAFTHPYLPISRNIHLQDTYFSHISGNSLLLSQKKYYKVCMNHAYIAWSIFARETHLREEDSREKGLYPLSLHNKKCHNQPILRPKVIREFDGSRYKNGIIDTLYGNDLSIETLSQSHLPCQLTRRDIGNIFRPSFSYSLSTRQSNEVSVPTIPSSFNNRMYTQPTSLSLYPSSVHNNLNNFQRHPNPYNTLACSELSSMPSSFKNSSKVFSTCASGTKCFHDLKNLELSSMIPLNLSNFLNPLLPSNVFPPDPENSHNTHLKLNLPLYSHRSLQPFGYS